MEDDGIFMDIWILVVRFFSDLEIMEDVALVHDMNSLSSRKV